MGEVIRYVLYIAAIFLYGLIWWKLFDKTGFGGIYGLTMYIPFINILMFFVLVFADWPALHKEYHEDLY